MLHAERHAPATTPRAGAVVLLHGFTQSGTAWAPVTEALTQAGHEVVTVDAPGHGASADVRADLWQAAGLIVEAAGEHPADYVGYSMGARMALHVALAHPDAVRRLVLVSGTGGIDRADERAARRAADEEVAQRAERDGTAAFLRWWLARPLFATLPPEAAALESRLAGTPAGLASSLRLAGTGTQEPLWDRLGAIAVPTLVVTGALDPAYCANGQRLVKAIGPNASLTVIPGAGHAVALEQPARFTATLLAFLDAA